jgi:plasmid replication initiation protein
MEHLVSPPLGTAGLDVFQTVSSEIAVRDVQDLMAYPWFSLAKSKRVRPIQHRTGELSLCVEGTAEHGIATIWDADVLIWAASQLVQARDTGLPTSRLLVSTPYEILRFIHRGTSVRDYERLKAAFDRLQSTTIATTIRQPNTRRWHRFSWINEWKERTTSGGHSRGVEIVVPEWFYAGVLDSSLVLTIARHYFDLTGGIERWLYRLMRKRVGRQTAGWRFDMRQLHQNSGSLSRYARFAFDVREIVRRQSLPGYRLALEEGAFGTPLLWCRPACAAVLRRLLRESSDQRCKTRG